MARLRSGDVVGPWTVGERLGSGGNADVWRATDRTDREVALKVIREESARAEPYKRFVREIRFLRELENKEGILELVDAHLPDAPARGDKPWLAMPVATLIPRALLEEPLATAVAALAVVARTVSRLHGIGVAHRDIKPNNLYRYEDRWLVGDFGLVAVPDLEQLTKAGKSIGPTHYMAYEMLIDARSADPKAADVYSLGKTLWALTTQVTFPPFGHQRADVQGHLIADYRYHANSGTLDQLIDRCTRDAPAEGPTMAQVADELSAWLTIPDELAPLDVSEFRGPLLAALAPELHDANVVQERKELAYGAVRRLTTLFGPINAALRQLSPRAETDLEADELVRNVVRTREYGGGPEIVFRHQRLSQIKAGSPYNPYALRVGRALELTTDGLLILNLLILVGHTKTMGSDFHWSLDARTEPIGTVQVEEMMRGATREAGEQLLRAVAVFTQKLAAGA